MKFETISVIGLGYIGLPTAAMFASRNKKVIGVDVNQHAIETINRGDIHIIEPDLDTMVHTAVSKGYLRATNTAESADAFLIAVPTPFKDSNTEIPEPDLSYIKAAIKSIATVLKKGDLVILESTSPVGTTEQIAQWLSEIRKDLSFPQTFGNDADINIAYCPERVLPGNVVRELVENDRVIGGMSLKCSERAVELYKTFVEGECVVTNSRTAEMAKLTENSCRDVQIAFANELSIICDKLDINIWELISLSNRHPRINILQPGPGVGGHCIAVDPWFMVSKTPDLCRLIKTSREVNLDKPEWVLEQVKSAIRECISNSDNKKEEEISIVCLGLTFKADIDDLRESPAMYIAQKLSDMHLGTVFAVEPNIEKLENKKIKLISKNEIGNKDIGLVLVKHKDFKGIEKSNFEIVLDTVGLWS